MLPRLLRLLLVASAASCAIPAMDAVHDLAAIHTPTDWRPQTPAMLTAAPAFYLGDLSAASQGAGSYAIPEHRPLELAMLQRIASVDLHDPARSIEVSAWMMVELLQDDYPAARNEAAKILARLAGTWIVEENAALAAVDTNIHLTAALQDFDQAQSRADFDAAISKIGQAPIPDAITALRILTALGRKANDYAFTSGEGNQHVFSTALRLILIGLEQGSKDADSTVAATCAHWVDLLSAPRT